MDANDDTSVAYTYAWWLTGDERAADAAVRAAVTTAGEDRRLATLLAEVRSVAAPTPTMCPASEVALLHDGHGLSLDEVARLAVVDPADVRTELAHGRIEALTETVIDPFVHPERLGGLAVANPADVAHARQCDNCAYARGLLEQGRSELRELVGVAVPGGLGESGGPLESGGVPESGGASESGGVPGSGGVPDPRGRPTLSRPRMLVIGALLAVAVIALVLLAVVGGDDPGGGDPPARDGSTSTLGASTLANEPAALPADPDDPAVHAPGTGGDADADAGGALGTGGDADPEGEPGTGEAADTDVEGDPGADAEHDEAGEDTSPTRDADAVPPAEPGAFAVESAGLVDAAVEPAGGGAALAPGDPLRLAVRYRGAGDGVTLVGRWTVDGAPFRELGVELTAASATHVFGAPAPPEGWPPGTHEIFLSAQDTVVAVVAFTVG